MFVLFMQVSIFSTHTMMRMMMFMLGEGRRRATHQDGRLRMLRLLGCSPS